MRLGEEYDPISKRVMPALSAANYRLLLPQDRPYVFVNDVDGARVAELFVLSSIHPQHGRDETASIGEWQIAETPDEIVLTLGAGSSVWDDKRYRFRCRPHRFTYEMEVVGEGRLSEVNYFGGYSSGHVRWGSGFFWSGHRFDRGFNPEPNAEELNYYTPAAGSVINLMGVPLPGRDDWFFTPPPFCFAFERGSGWIGMGVEAQPGANQFTEYQYHGRPFSFYLSLAFEGHTRVDGVYRLPAIGFDFGGDEFQVLEKHVQSLRQAGYVPAANHRAPAEWWYEPIFCGWGAQCHVAAVEKGVRPAYARQDRYEGFLKTLTDNGVEPGIVVIDDKWQATYGDNQADEDKWPDLRGFIATQHGAGRKVLLWLKAWDPEGIPADECITNGAGVPIAVDPTNPRFERRLRASVRNMLSADGYDADGFKIDFSARIPSGSYIHLHGETWGLELMKLYLGLIYDEARRTKADALVMTHTPHPYLSDVLDMIRLNDMNHDKDPQSAMRLRARIAAIACPDALIDTDNWPVTNLAQWREYARLQAELGVPSLYYTTHVDTSGESLATEDYHLLRDLWAAYRAKLKNILDHRRRRTSEA